MTTLTIKVTKDVLKRSKDCTNGLGCQSNCAIALAVRDIFPDAYVDLYAMWFDKKEVGNAMAETALLPKEARRFIEQFDRKSPEERVMMKGISFDIQVPDKVVEKINIDELKPLLENHPTLKLQIQ